MGPAFGEIVLTGQITYLKASTGLETSLIILEMTEFNLNLQKYKNATIKKSPQSAKFLVLLN
jgi:hypothetical protein